MSDTRDPQVQIVGSHDTLFVCPTTGAVNTHRSVYDGDEYINIVKFDVEEWEQHYRELFRGGDILDYAYWSRETDPDSWNWGRVTRYDPAEPSVRGRWKAAILEAAARYAEFTHYPIHALDAAGGVVTYRDPRCVAHECAIGSADINHIACWSVFGMLPDRQRVCLSDHKSESQAAQRQVMWEEALASASSAPDVS